MIKTFADVFLVSLVEHLKGGMDLEERLLWLLVRYKQRVEWFGGPEFMRSETASPRSRSATEPLMEA